MAVYRSRGNLSSTSFASSWSLPAAPGTQDGDLLIMALCTQEWILGFSALIVRPSGFTDLLTDGFDPGAPYGKQYVLDPSTAPRLFVWVGYRFAANEPANYSISASGTSGGLQGDVYAYALPGDIRDVSLDHVDAAGGGVPVSSYDAQSVTLDTNHRTIVAVMFGGYMSTAITDNGYGPPASMTSRACDATDGVPNDSWTLADETVAGSSASSGNRTFTVLSGSVTNRAAIMLSIGGVSAAGGAGRLPLLGAG